MLTVIEATGQIISAAQIIAATLRTDMVPVPVSLELSVQSTPELDAAITLGATLLVGDPAIAVTIVKVLPITTQSIKEGRKVGGISCTAVLSGCQRMIEPTNRAIILSNTSFAEIFRACGCRLAVELDLPVSSFVCLRGQIPTTLIAKALQQESAVMFLRQGRLVFWRVSELLKEPPLLRYDPSAVQWEDNPVVLAKSKISFFSVALDGSTIERPTPTASRPVSYYPKLSERQLMNLEKVLIRRGTMLRPMDQRLNAGVVLHIEDQVYVVLTAAHHFASGALGGASAMATKIWFANLEK